MSDRPPTDTLDLDLERAARAYAVPAGDVDAVVRRAARRQSRRHRAVVGLSVVALVAATTAGVELLADDPATTVRTATAPVRGDAGVVWQRLAPMSGLGFSTQADPAAPLYALSTAPGEADLRPDEAMARRVLWRSEDGVEWTALSTLGADLFVSDLAARDGRVYAVGTGPATAAVGGRPVSPLLAGWSDDEGRTWQKAPLPLDLEAIAARSTRSAVETTSVAVGPHGTVVAGVLHARADVNALLPAGVSAPDGWALSATGVDLLGPDRGPRCPEGTRPPDEEKVAVPPEAQSSGEVQAGFCLAGDGNRVVTVSPQDLRGVIASYTWADLGVDGDLLRAVRRQPVAFLAAPGSDRFERVALPDVESVRGPVLLDASPEGFTLVTTTGAGWAPDGPPGTLTVLTSIDGATWRLDDAVSGPDVYAAATGRVGGALTVVAHRRGGGVVLRREGSGGWTTTALSDIVDPAVHKGKEVFVSGAGVGPFGVVAAVMVASDRETLDHRVVVSRDGRTWGDSSLEELAGRPVRNVIRAAVVGDRATVAVSVTPKDGDRPEQLVLVGAAD